NALEIAWDGSKITHSQPKRISDGVMSNKPLYLASQDLALFPVYVDKPLPGDSTGKVFPENGAFIRALDYSKSSDLASLSNYSRINIEEDLRIHDEPQIVEISDKGNLMAMVRTTKGIYFTTSSDYGLNWNPVEPFTASGPTTSSRFYLGKLASGNLLLISNISTTRNNMTAFISADGGKTWPHKLLLDGRDNVSYPDADQTPDGRIHVVFDRERTSAKDILYCRFTEEDVIKGNTDMVFKTRVNK
ncbi:sialidase family protein, partial [Daejeonella sp.]|uniref:sialidase family protein n=1 Tax=Daejeonella sp. TaxID=2805397 RepID=UPI002731DF6C